MGGSGSKPGKSRTRSLKLNKKDILATLDSDVQTTRRIIEVGEVVNYDLYRSNLSISANKVQEIKVASKKAAKKDYCTKILDDINKCIKLLEEKERDDDRESNLDLGAVESHSFIQQDLDKVNERKEKQREDRIRSLSQIKERTDELDEEIRKHVGDNDIRSLIIIEKKVNLLYNDLEDITPFQDSTAMLEKERLADRLIKFNRKISNVKRKSGIVDGNDGGYFSKPAAAAQSDLLDIMRMEHELSDLEVNAFTFEDIRYSSGYASLEQKLKRYYTNLENVVTANEDERRRAVTAKNLIKKILSSLKQKAIENEDLKARQLLEIEKIGKSVSEYKTQSEYLTTKESDNYVSLDQKIRSAWDRLNHVNTHFVDLKEKKESLIVDIQSLLRNMSETCGEFSRRESRRKQLKEFKTTLSDLKRSETIKHDQNSRLLLEEIESSLRKFLSDERPDILKQKKHSVSSEVMDQLVTELTSSNKMIKADPVEDLTNFQDRPIPKVTATESMGRIQRIEKEITTLRSSIRNFPGTTDSDIYDGIEDKLLKNKIELEAIEADNRIVSNAKDRTLKKIEDANMVLRSKAEVNDEHVQQLRRSSHNLNRRSIKSSGKELERIMAIDSSVHAVQKQIDKFNGSTTDKEYEAIVKKLRDGQEELAGMDISKRDTLQSSKIEVLNHIDKLLVAIATKASENEAVATDELTKLREILQHVKQTKKKIDCFNGTYRNIQFNQLDSDLRYNLDNIEGIKDVHPKITTAKDRTKETIAKYLKILDERSVKPQQSNVMTLERASINLLDVKNRMEYFSGTVHDDEYFQIIRDLHVCSDEMKLLSDEGEPGEKKIQYLSYIQDLFNYFDEKMNKREEHVNDSKVQENLRKLEQYSGEADEISGKVEMFDGSKSEMEYCELDEGLIELMIKVDKVYTFRLDEIKDKRKAIMQRLNKCAEVLDAKCRPLVDSAAAPDRDKILREIAKIVDEVAVLNDAVGNFEGTKNDQHYINLDESLIRLFLRLDSVNPSSDSVAKNGKLKAMKEIKRNMRLLEERVKGVVAGDDSYGLEETLV